LGSICEADGFNFTSTLTFLEVKNIGETSISMDSDAT